MHNPPAEVVFLSWDMFHGLVGFLRIQVNMNHVYKKNNPPGCHMSCSTKTTQPGTWPMVDSRNGGLAESLPNKEGSHVLYGC